MENSNELIQLGIVLISGPPGIGKSTLSKNLATHANKQNSKPTHALALSYDKIINKNIEDHLIDKSGEASKAWKTGRSIILSLTSVLVDFLKNEFAKWYELKVFAQVQEFFHEKLDKNLTRSTYFTAILENFLKCLELVRYLNFQSLLL